MSTVDSTIYRNFLRSRCSVDSSITWKTWFGRALMEFLIGDNLAGADWTNKLASDIAHRIDQSVVKSWKAPNEPREIDYQILKRHLSFIVSIYTA
jgi:hypothetical protein